MKTFGGNRELSKVGIKVVIGILNISIHGPISGERLILFGRLVMNGEPYGRRRKILVGFSLIILRNSTLVKARTGFKSFWQMWRPVCQTQ
jgi:hypothetical protein